MKDASELYRAMRAAVRSDLPRAVADASSPQRTATIEASVGSTFTLDDPRLNVPTCRAVDLRWAAANLLHFFAATEEAGALRKYNRRADQFLVDDRWIGAYGAVAVPQIEACIQLLRRDPLSRRAVVSMGSLEYQDINRPPCWSFLHFLQQSSHLHLLVYQRSLNLTGVMPYDCVVLTNALLYAAGRLGVPAGPLHWTIGSLHRPLGVTDRPPEFDVDSIVYPVEILSDPQLCMRMLEEGL